MASYACVIMDTVYICHLPGCGVAPGISPGLTYTFVVEGCISDPFRNGTNQTYNYIGSTGAVCAKTKLYGKSLMLTNTFNLLHNFAVSFINE